MKEFFLKNSKIKRVFFNGDDKGAKLDLLKVVNPFNEQTLTELKMITESEVAKYFGEMEKIISQKKNWLPKKKRLEILQKFKTLLIEHKDELIQIALGEGGKPLNDSRVEIERGIEGVGIAMEELKALAGKEIPMNISGASQERMAYTFYRPRGVVLAISAFNHPFNLIIHQVIPALAAGCPVLVKPASSTPLSCKKIMDLLYEAGLDPSYARMILCSAQSAQKLVGHPLVSFLSFIGSAQVGWKLRSLLAPGAACALEHGGIAPVIIDETADLEATLGPLLKGGYYHAGQVCVSVQRVFIHHSKREEFVEKFKEGVKKLKVGDPASSQTEVGPLIAPGEVERVHSWVGEAVKMGGCLEWGGEPMGKTCYTPTLLSEVPEEATVNQREIFGPVVVVQSYDCFETAMERANSVDYAFQASLFTQHLDRALWAATELEGRSIMINDHTAFRVDWMPFGGYRRSGLGLGGIGHSLRDLSLEKMVVIKCRHLT